MIKSTAYAYLNEPNGEPAVNFKDSRNHYLYQIYANQFKNEEHRMLYENLMQSKYRIDFRYEITDEDFAKMPRIHLEPLEGRTTIITEDTKPRENVLENYYKDGCEVAVDINHEIIFIDHMIQFDDPYNFSFDYPLFRDPRVENQRSLYDSMRLYHQSSYIELQRSLIQGIPPELIIPYYEHFYAMEFEGGENYDIYRNYKNGKYNADEIMFKDGIITETEQEDFLHLPKIFNAPEYTMIDTKTTLLEFTDFYKDNSQYNLKIKIEDLLKYYKIGIDMENKIIILDYFEVCELCGQNIAEHKGCDCKAIELNGVIYARVKAGGDGDYHQGSESFKACECCGVQKEKHHHYGCTNEYCPACGITLIKCDCSREQSKTELKNGVGLDSRESLEERERIYRSRKGINDEDETYNGPFLF